MKFVCNKITDTRSRLNFALKWFLAVSKNDKDEMVLKYGDTVTTYPMWCAKEPDAKSPQDWLNANLFHMDFSKFQGVVEFTLKKVA